MSMVLRDYQDQAMRAVQGVYRSGRRRALLVAPTGSGKSAMTRYMLGRTTKRTLILCHRSELQDMIAEAMPVPFGIIGGSRRVPSENVHLGMMQTVSRRLADLPTYDWVISDEAHLAMCATWRRILGHYSAAWHLGMSATPCRLDGQGLGAEYEEIVYGPSVRELTERGFLVPCRVFAPPVRAALKGGTMAQDADALDHASITGDAIEHYQRLARGRQAIVFCSSRQHADNVAAQFTQAGLFAANVDGAMQDSERRRRIADFRARRLQVLVNVDLLTTGFDCPQIECGIMLRRTDSLALFLQKVGRILRLNDGKRDAVLLDHVGNVLKHGMPDADREWTLEGREKRRQAVSVCQCPKCYAAHTPGPRCPSCGHVYTSAAGRTPPKQVDCVLEAVDGQSLPQLGGDKLQAALKAARRMPSDPERRAALDAIRKAMGYKPGWTFAQMQMLARFRTGRRAA